MKITLSNNLQLLVSGPHRVLTSRILQPNFTSCGDINLLSRRSSHLLLLNKTDVFTFFQLFVHIKMLLQAFCLCCANMESSIETIMLNNHAGHSCFLEMFTIWTKVATYINISSRALC